jgi:hypothetical protein
MIIKLYDTWRKAKQVFVKPSLRVYFGNWRNDTNWVCGSRRRIYLVPRKHLYKYTHQVNDRVLVKVRAEELSFGDTTYTSERMEWSTHKLPEKLTQWDIVWNKKVRKKLKKYHLGWIPPVIYLPTWFDISIVNRDVSWKTKYDEIRYEFPPVFAIRIFGLSLSFGLYCPVKSILACDDHYWETILTYLYDNKSRTLLETIEHMGIWGRYGKNNELINYFSVRPEYIKPEYLDEYYAATSDIKIRKNQIIL